jgi:hypothetical protein
MTQGCAELFAISFWLLAKTISSMSFRISPEKLCQKNKKTERSTTKYTNQTG